MFVVGTILAGSKDAGQHPARETWAGNLTRRQQ